MPLYFCNHRNRPQTKRSAERVVNTRICSPRWEPKRDFGLVSLNCSSFDLCIQTNQAVRVTIALSSSLAILLYVVCEENFFGLNL